MCTLHQHQHPSHDPHLWWGSKCHQKSTLGACGGVLRSQDLVEGQERNTAQLERIEATIEWRWGSEGAVGKKENGDDAEGSEDGPGESQEEGTLSSASC